MVEILRLNLYGSFLIATLLMVRKIFEKRWSRQTFYYAWMIITGFYLFGGIFMVLADKNLFFREKTEVFFCPPHSYIEKRIAVNSEKRIFFYIWIAGSVFLMAYFIAMYSRQLKKLKKGCLLENSLVQKWKKENPQREKIDIWLMKGLEVPLTYGIGKSHIVLPEGICFTEVEIYYVLNHEFVHIRRKDTLFKLVLLFLTLISWFNPLMWVMLFYANRDMELSCDEIVLETMGIEHRKGYASLLLWLGVEERGMTLMGSEFSKGFIQKRIELLLKYTGRTRKKLFLKSFVCSCFLIGAVTFVYMANVSYNELLPVLKTKVPVSWEKERLLYLAEFLKENTGVTQEELRELPPLQVNENGQTLGDASFKPDLVPVQTVDGKKGYAYYDSVYSVPEFKTPGEALAWQEERRQKGEAEHIAVYEEDGTTVIGCLVK